MKKNLTKVIFLILALALAIIPVLAISSFATEGANGEWTLVTDASTLAAGDQIVIAASASNVALSTTQNGNNRGQIAITKSGNVIEITNDVQVITLEEGNTDGTFAFNVGDGYLYAASSSSNYLRTETTLSANSSWKITISEGIATVVAQGTNTRNTMQYNQQSSLFACYGSASQKAISIYKYIENTSTEEYTPTFYVDGVETIFGENLDLFPDAPELDDCYSGYEFVGWAKENVVKSTIQPDVFKPGEDITIKEDTNFYAIYKWAVVGDEITAYVKKDIKEINAQDIVVITMTTSDGTVYALSNDNGTKAAPTATIITVGNDAIAGEVADNIKWNIATTTDGYTFYPNGTTDTWLYCTNTNNGVRVGDNTANTFVIDAASGYLKHNGTSRYLGVYTTNPDWRCYTSTETNIANQTLGFYIASTTTGTQDYFSSTLPGAIFESASVTIGDTLAMNYYVSIVKDNVTMDGSYVKFTFNGEDTVVENCPLVNNKYMFTFSGIFPDQMNDAIKAELYDSNGNAVDIYGGYTVKQYLEDLKALYPDDTELVALIDATLTYGAAAQKYRNPEIADENLVATIPDNLTAPESANVYELTTNETIEGFYFTNVGVNFDYCNRLYVRYVNTNNLDVKVTIDDVECTEVFNNNGVYTVYTDALKATQLGSEVVFKLYNGETLVQQLSYSVYDYVYAKKGDDAAELSDLAILVRALYNYGEAAIKYEAAQAKN